MAGAQLGAALRQIQRLFSEGSSTGLSDTHLLNRFATRRDEFVIDFRDIYATLLRRWLNIDPAPVLGRRNEDLAIF
jgi:hypothetical protein